MHGHVSTVPSFDHFLTDIQMDVATDFPEAHAKGQQAPKTGDSCKSAERHQAPKLEHKLCGRACTRMNGRGQWLGMNKGLTCWPWGSFGVADAPLEAHLSDPCDTCQCPPRGHLRHGVRKVGTAQHSARAR